MIWFFGLIGLVLGGIVGGVGGGIGFGLIGLFVGFIVRANDQSKTSQQTNTATEQSVGTSEAPAAAPSSSEYRQPSSDVDDLVLIQQRLDRLEQHLGLAPLTAEGGRTSIAARVEALTESVEADAPMPAPLAAVAALSASGDRLEVDGPQPTSTWRELEVAADELFESPANQTPPADADLSATTQPSAQQDAAHLQPADADPPPKEADAPVWAEAAVPPPSEPSPISRFFGRLIEGNIVAKIGVVVLFFGIGFMFKLAYEDGLFRPG